VGVRGSLPENNERALCVAQQADGGVELLGGGAQGFLEPPRRVEGADVDELFEEGACLCFGDLLVQNLCMGGGKVPYKLISVDFERSPRLELSTTCSLSW
jgi:hypothetical protein